MPPTPPITHLYLRLPNWIGDVCMCLPALTLFKNTGLPLVVCARSWAKELLSGMTPHHDFIAIQGKLWQDRAALRAHIHQHGPGGRALTLPHSFSSALRFWLAGLPVAGYRDDGRSPLLRWPIDLPTTPLHNVTAWYQLTHTVLTQWHLPAGAAAPGPCLDLSLTEMQRHQAQHTLAQHGLQSKKFILIAPTAAGRHDGKSKIWPGYAALTCALQAQGFTVVMSPPPSEIQLAQHHAPTARLLPALSLGTFAAFTRHATLVICNDSGVSHLAAAANARSLTLFGVTSYAENGPWSPHAHCLGTMGAWPTIKQVTEHVLTLCAQPG